MLATRPRTPAPIALTLYLLLWRIAIASQAANRQRSAGRGDSAGWGTAASGAAGPPSRLARHGGGVRPPAGLDPPCTGALYAVWHGRFARAALASIAAATPTQAL